jgi:hypothetical protein
MACTRLALVASWLVGAWRPERPSLRAAHPPMFTSRRTVKRGGGSPPLTVGSTGEPGGTAGSPHQRRLDLSGRKNFPRGVRPLAHRLRPVALSHAPVGSTPVDRNCQSAISNFRASATLPSFRSRALPWPNRVCYHRASSLSGLNRHQPRRRDGVAPSE